MFKQERRIEMLDCADGERMDHLAASDTVD